MDNILSNAFRMIHNSNPDVINFIDVGVYMGAFLEKVKNFSYPKNIFSIGIDPWDKYQSSAKYNVFYNCAVDDVKEEENLPFHFNEDCDACSSLLKMNSDIVTHNISEYETKWYCPVPIQKISKVDLVKVNSLSNILDQNQYFQTNKIHYLKIDTEGVDIRVVKSAEKYLKNVFFIQIETVSDKSSVTLFQNQTKLSEDVKIMNRFGFELFDYIDYSLVGLSPNVDAVFINRNIKL